MDWFNNLFRRWWRKRVEARFLKCLEDESAEHFLELLLRLVGLALRLDGSFRRNIDGFTGRYQFKSADGFVAVAALFDNGGLTVRNALITEPDVTVTFVDSRALMSFLLAENKDILRYLLNNEVALQGNANYIFKFGYMANHLQLALTGRLAHR